MRKLRDEALDTNTVDPAPNDREQSEAQLELTLTILGHPDVARVGEVCVLDPESPVLLSRVEPKFSPPGVSDSFPLADPATSRKPIHLVPKKGGVEVAKIEGGALIADGRTISAPASFSEEAIDRGVVLTVGRVVLFLQRRSAIARSRESLGFIGESSAMHALRRQILTIANLDVPVLIRGETGSGKELVARALHLQGPRKDAPYRAVNMAAISPTLAASELFGHAKGAFTGAERAHEGFFVECHRGTLFLDEVGETPIEVQAMLLRTLENGAIQRVGGGREEMVDVRLITATDADLEELVRSGAFRGPLLHRLSGYELCLPPLRERRDDIGRLLYAFLREELNALGTASVLDLSDPRDPPWLAPETVARLCAYDWPGNVRQLRNVARQLAISNGRLDRLPAIEEPEAEPPKPRARKRRPAEVTEDELADVLAKHRWRLDDAADELGISRSSMYLLIDKSTRFRKAKDLDRDELMAAHQQASGDLERMSEILQVSIGGLRLRLKKVLGE